MNIFLRIYNTLFCTMQRQDLSRWEHPVNTDMPIYGVYHVFCADGWQSLVKAQVEHLRTSGLLDATAKLYVSCVALHEGDVDILKQIIEKSSYHQGLYCWVTNNLKAMENNPKH